jgi:hypothetical protein
MFEFVGWGLSPTYRAQARLQAFMSALAAALADQ